MVGECEGDDDVSDAEEEMVVSRGLRRLGLEGWLRTLRYEVEVVVVVVVAAAMKCLGGFSLV